MGDSLAVEPENVSGQRNSPFNQIALSSLQKIAKIPRKEIRVRTCYLQCLSSSFEWTLSKCVEGRPLKEVWEEIVRVLLIGFTEPLALGTAQPLLYLRFGSADHLEDVLSQLFPLIHPLT